MKGNHMTTGQWFGTIFLTTIPLVGVILLLVWAFGATEYPDRKAYARATLIWSIIGAVIGTIATIATGGSLLLLLDGLASM